MGVAFSYQICFRRHEAMFSPGRKVLTWRKLWIILAKGLQHCEIDISDEQIQELEDNAHKIDFKKIDEYEEKFKHDVVANIHQYAEVAPKAASIIHLGATSCYVTDNADAIMMRLAFDHLIENLTAVIKVLAKKATKYADTPCLAFTHLQPAQFTTVGKRFSLWLQDLCTDYEQLLWARHLIPFLGAKGATGTQASFLTLLGNYDKVRKLDKFIANEIGWKDAVNISGQTYSRKYDHIVLSSLVGLAATCAKIGRDIRILQSKREIFEPFGKTQVGSSAMPYKRNPMKSERVCSLARYVISKAGVAAQTAATQWLERTLDDSAVRRLIIPEMFLAADSIIILMYTILSDLCVNMEEVERSVWDNMPHIIMEEILMKATKWVAIDKNCILN